MRFWLLSWFRRRSVAGPVDPYMDSEDFVDIPRVGRRSAVPTTERLSSIPAVGRFPKVLP